jgi:hypothetical protein
MKSNLPDADMQGVPAALLRAALRARETARQTNTPLVFMKDGVVVKEMVTDDEIDQLKQEIEDRGFARPNASRTKA